MNATVDLSRITIEHGKHNPPIPPDFDDPTKIQACTMEWKYLLWALSQGWSIEKIIAGWTDHPPCFSTVATNTLIAFNDRCKDKARRTRVAIQLLGLTCEGGSAALEQRRQWALYDWSTRFATPKLLRAANPGLADFASKLEALAPITDRASYEAARRTIVACRDACWNSRSRAYARLRELFGAEAVEAVAAVAEAVAEAAEAVVVAVVAAAVVAVAVEAVAVEAVAEAAVAEAAVVAVEAVKKLEGARAEHLREVIDAVLKVYREGGDYWARRAAARKVIDRLLGEGKLVLNPALAAVRDELDVAFVAQIKLVCAMTEEP